MATATRRRSAETSPPSRSAPLVGEPVPRIFTPPLVKGKPGGCVCGCALTPETSYGWDVIEFAEGLGRPLDPWQSFCAVHLGELIPSPTGNGLIPRFRTVLIMVARQNGKTHFLAILALYWLFIERQKLILGTSSKLEYAKDSFKMAVGWAEADDREGGLSADLELGRTPGGRQKRAVVEGNNDVHMETRHGCIYKVAPANRKGGRSLTVRRLILDELREHRDHEAYKASFNAMNAVEDAQCVAITNQGDEGAVVLDDLREAAIEFIETGEGDDSLCLLEYSAPPEADIMDPETWRMANPNLGIRVQERAIRAQAIKAKQKGGELLTGFKTEVCCIRVNKLDPAVDLEKWNACFLPGRIADVTAAGGQLALVLDVSPDLRHATLASAAQMPDGRTRIGVAAAWDDLARMRKELPEILRKARPKAFGWFPNGPAAAVSDQLSMLKTSHGQPRSEAERLGITVSELGMEASDVCMTFASLVEIQQVVHGDDVLLNAHVTGSSKLRNGDKWRFSRRGAGHCDGAYAAAGGVYLARTLPAAYGKIGLIVRKGR